MALLEPHVSVSYSELSQLHFYQWGKSSSQPGNLRRDILDPVRNEKISFLWRSKKWKHIVQGLLAFQSEKGFCVSFLAFKAMLRPWGTRALELFAVTFNLSLSTRSNDFSWKWDVAGTDSHFCCGSGDWICCENAKKHIFCIECELICIQSWLNHLFYTKKEINTVYAQWF